MAGLTQVKGWHYRGFLPHYDAGAVLQTVTFRLADSLPAEKLHQWRQELSGLPKERETAEYQQRIEQYLDLGHGEAWLRNPRVAGLVEQALLHFEGTRYHLYAWVVMPNHVHALLEPGENQSLSAIIHSWKSYTSRRASALLGRRGRFWQEDYFDRYIRSAEHFEETVYYIHMNPVRAGLTARPEDWPFGSTRHHHQLEQKIHLE